MGRLKTTILSLGIALCLWAAIELLCFALIKLYFQPKVSWKEEFVVSDLDNIAELDEELFWRLKKNFRGINSQGFRGREFPGDFQKRKKILFLGDSVVFGWNVPYKKNFCSLVQDKLDSLYPGQYWVINAGVPGYSSYQALKYFKEISSRIKPDMVITYLGANDCWNEGNFIRDSEKTQAFRRLNLQGKWPVMRLISRSNIFKTVQLFKIIHFGKWKRLRVLPDEFSDNLNEIQKLALEGNARFIVVNPIFTDFKQFYYRPQDLLVGVEDIRFFESRDEEIIRNLRPNDYYREDGVTLKALGNNSPAAIFMDYWHPNEKGHKEIADILFVVIDQEIKSVVRGSL